MSTPTLNSVSVETHVLQPDGGQRLVLRVAGPLPDDPQTVLADVDGVLTVDGDDGLVSWVWPSSMCPPDPVAICSRHVMDVLSRWACSWAGGPIDLTDGSGSA